MQGTIKMSVDAALRNAARPPNSVVVLGGCFAIEHFFYGIPDWRRGGHISFIRLHLHASMRALAKHLGAVCLINAIHRHDRIMYSRHFGRAMPIRAVGASHLSRTSAPRYRSWIAIHSACLSIHFILRLTECVSTHYIRIVCTLIVPLHSGML